MALILAPPMTQFIDADGEPYAGGTVETYTPGTTTQKPTWQDNGQTILNTNPIVLDSAGRCLLLGDGDYRLIIRDSTGQLVYDGWSTSVVSDAMQPVVAAPTIAQAVALLGITALIQAETNRAEAAETTLTNNLNAEIARAEAAETNLQNELNAEIARAEAAEAHLQAEIDGAGGGILPAGYSIRFGHVTSDGGGNFNGFFSPAFPTTCDSLTCTAWGRAWWACIDSHDQNGFTGKTSSPLFGGGWDGGPIGVDWIAIGH